MSDQDAELEQMRAGVSCAVLLERHPSPWQLDRKESTRRCLKYRRAKGEILLVNHEGRGWWDPGSTAKGDIFALVQYLNPGANFGEVRKILRPFIGLSPSFPLHETASPKRKPDVPFPVQWDRRKAPSRGSPTWRYLTEARRVPAAVVAAAISAGVLREGPYASAWFAHRDHDGQLTGIEMRGPAYRGFSPGGTKTLFRLPGWPRSSTVPTIRLVVAEAPIDAMSVAALEQLRADTLYVATAGGMGPGTIAALEYELWALSTQEGGEMAIATDADGPGDRYAERLEGMARAIDLRSTRLRPLRGANDWNDVLKQGRGS
jgi:Protein of unknown function (DUF3991)/Toprim-like